MVRASRPKNEWRVNLPGERVRYFQTYSEARSCAERADSARLLKYMDGKWELAFEFKEGEPVDVDRDDPPEERAQPVPGEGSEGLFHSLFGGGAESTDDLAHGQVVIIAARWVLIVAGLVLALWITDDTSNLAVQLVVILGLAVGNFYLHSQVLQRRPTMSAVVYAASAGDLTVISLLVGMGGGLESGLFVFYFPAILALSVAFHPRVTALFAGTAILVYGVIGAATLSGAGGEVLVTRLIMLAAVAVCGSIYWQVERSRREAAAERQESLLAQVKREVPAGQ
ncbi:MAG: hypothetical protein IH862_06510 [Chloroflexi bacterium]|nr:hypothetical protein [Chloroflexota bacterium]